MHVSLMRPNLFERRAAYTDAQIIRKALQLCITEKVIGRANFGVFFPIYCSTETKK